MISNPDKILFPKSKITKQDLINYYQEIAPHMLPFMHNRPLTMHRFPNGINHEGFFQKDASTFFPDWIKTISVPKKEGGVTHYVVCQDEKTLIYLANLACITPHMWLSTIDHLHYPDRMIFDLDPSTNNFALTAKIAVAIKKILEEVKLTPYLMTTGSRGLHVVVHLNASVKYNVVKKCAQQVAQLVVHEYPKEATIDIRKNKRGKKLFIDTLRNNYTATSVCPYAVRAHEYAPVATPLYWEELSNKKLRSNTFTIKTVLQKIKSDGNPWKNFFSHVDSL